MKLLLVGFFLDLSLQTEPDLRVPSVMGKTDEGEFKHSWGALRSLDSSGSAATMEGNAPLAPCAPASSRAAGLLQRMALPLDRPFCFYTLHPNLCISMASHSICVYLLWQKPKDWNSLFTGLRNEAQS